MAVAEAAAAVVVDRTTERWNIRGIEVRKSGMGGSKSEPLTPDSLF